MENNTNEMRERLFDMQLEQVESNVKTEMEWVRTRTAEVYVIVNRMGTEGERESDAVQLQNLTQALLMNVQGLNVRRAELKGMKQAKSAMEWTPKS